MLGELTTGRSSTAVEKLARWSAVNAATDSLDSADLSSSPVWRSSLTNLLRVGIGSQLGLNRRPLIAVKLVKRVRGPLRIVLIKCHGYFSLGAPEGHNSSSRGLRPRLTSQKSFTDPGGVEHFAIWVSRLRRENVRVICIPGALPPATRV